MTTGLRRAIEAMFPGWECVDTTVTPDGIAAITLERILKGPDGQWMTERLDLKIAIDKVYNACHHLTNELTRVQR